MLDESLLDTPERLTEADRRGLLRGAAEAGARVRTAARHAAEAGVGNLKPDGRPRAVLIAGPGAAATHAADLLGTLAGAGSPVIRLAPTGVAAAAGALRWELPGWAGSVDLLLIATPDGAEPGLSLLAEQAYRRGCTVVAVAPGRSPLSDAVSASHGLLIPMATAPYDHDEPLAGAAPGVLWALLTPLLALLDRTALLDAPPEALDKVADRLDRVAERCGPAVVTYSNPAKTLATELAESLPVIWTEGTSAGPAGRRFAAALAELSGTPAVVADLPEALAAHNALLAGQLAAAADPDDFFRDRVEEAPALHARVVLLRDRPSGGLTAAPNARDLALGHDTPISELEPEAGGELETLAELIAVTDFAAVYLALASGA
ncbi:mannose-6-phosphate isomerase [Streptomyces olivaceus]|uniref:Mannose-6-phosphate isomerase n=1 Tax=Streptomyces olivaceus TaxID=47716 RepID=A0ABS7WBG4_STROV|nr:SIS domain-containing protein [Streptomyces olivaceus]MBZ6092621.1 mannose-6-phosphate isomerase [Streptomyces olivaceus]MBZ6099495.1 mannose-6-phosphate isomerase [Streptomyces olivaceus]MBZ6120465.1 mannose-6-phosphate isomerase [Streptomyces olivaceus]MBZ6155300.1 mannose-6-phosphate isomerase [Streptomyces olivaceus]MBZ6301535.1 mannose-6-phosphate isomerase [Streptomyces olivaceus]